MPKSVMPILRMLFFATLVLMVIIGLAPSYRTPLQEFVPYLAVVFILTIIGIAFEIHLYNKRIREQDEDVNSSYTPSPHSSATQPID